MKTALAVCLVLTAIILFGCASQGYSGGRSGTSPYSTVDRCEAEKNPRARDSCYKQIATSLGDFYFCAEITSDEQRGDCYFLITEHLETQVSQIDPLNLNR